MIIYFDHAATTKVCPEAATAAMTAMTEQFGNPSSGHCLGIAAANAVKGQRGEIARVLGCLPEELYFTSCGTEGDNWAVSIATKLGRRTGKHIISTAVEHAAILEPLRLLEQQGYEVTYLQPDRSGHISLEDFKAALRPDTVLVSVMLVNNETGSIQPVREIAAYLRQIHATTLLHTDAVQGFLKIPFTPKDLGVDLLTISGHKVGALKGSGALYIRKGLKAPAQLLGGGQENGLRSGTEATPQIAAFAAACTAAAASFESHMQWSSELKAYALERLQAVLPELVVVSAGDAPHICAISLPGYPSEMLVRALSDCGICLSSGSACHKGKPSHVFAAMRLPPRVLKSILRISFSHDNTKEEVDALCEALLHITKERVSAGR